MKKYRVRIEGKNFVVKIDETVEKLGFFTTRFIEAEKEADAEEKALNLIRDELRDVVLNDRSDPPAMFTEEIVELDSFGDNLIPGRGFTWYSDDEASTKSGLKGQVSILQKWTKGLKGQVSILHKKEEIEGWLKKGKHRGQVSIFHK